MRTMVYANDVTIISGDDEEILTNKCILSIFSPNLGHILSTSSTLVLPNCSTFSIKYLLNMIHDGFVVAEKLSNEDINEIIRTAQLLSINMRGLSKSNNISTRSKSNELAIDISQNKNDENDKSSLDVIMNSLNGIFDHDGGPENVNIGENFSILDESKGEEHQAKVKGKKRNRSYISQNNSGAGKYQCQQCDYQSIQSYALERHVKTVHEDVRYPCNLCDYRATRKYSLKIHNEYKHQGIRYPCDQCDYKATQKGDLRRHKESRIACKKY